MAADQSDQSDRPERSQQPGDPGRMEWEEAIAVDQVGESRFRATVDEHWTSLQGAHGGIVAALALAATEEVLTAQDVDPTTSLRAATFGYVSGNVIGGLDIDVEVVRQGRAMVTTHATTSQEGKTTTVCRFHHSTPWEGTDRSDAPAMVPMPRDTSQLVQLDWPGVPAHLNNVTCFLDPSTTLFGGAERPEWLAWARPLEGDAFDARWLVMFGDYFPPAAFAQVTEPVRAVSIEYSIQVHSAARSWDLGPDGHLASRVHAFHAADGFAVEDGWFHLPDGTLVATTRQTRLSG